MAFYGLPWSTNLSNESCVQHPIPRDLEIPVSLASTFPSPFYIVDSPLQPVNNQISLLCKTFSSTILKLSNKFSYNIIK